MAINKKELFQQFVDSIPAIQMENPYWSFDKESEQIISHLTDEKEPLNIKDWFDLLTDVKTYFKHVFNSFNSEAQVLCVNDSDTDKLDTLQIPSLPNSYKIGNKVIRVYVLPQENSYYLTSVSEDFWQKHIIGQGITPIARIHSHHELEPYQSPTDYASLNSNTLEIVIGQIDKKPLSLGFWLDQRGKKTKEKVWVYKENKAGQIRIPCGKMRKNDIDKNKKTNKEKENL